jgi:hypothetical protein
MKIYYLKICYKLRGFSQRLLIGLQFYFGFLDLVVVKYSDVSEGRTAFIFRTIKLPCCDASVTGGNIYLQYSTPLDSLADTVTVAEEKAQVYPASVGLMNMH